MRKSYGKKLISLLLAVLMVLSSLTVGFVAFAADETEEPSKSAPVAAVEAAIAEFNTNKYNTLMFSTKAEEAEQKAAALKAFEDICGKIAKLTDEQKIELEITNYVYIMAIAADKVGRDAGKTSYDAKVYGSTDGFAEVTKLMGALPADYQKGYDFMKDAYVLVSGQLFSSSFDFAAYPDGNAHFEAVLAKAKALSPKAAEFANYGYANKPAFYFYCSYPTTVNKYFWSNMRSWATNYEQDKVYAKSPSTPSYSTFISHKYSSGSYTDTWLDGMNGKVYLDTMTSFYNDTYVKAFDEPAAKTMAILFDVMEGVLGKDAADAAKGIYENGLKVYNGETVTTAAVTSSLDKFNALSAPTQDAVNELMYFKVASKLVLGDVKYDESLTAKDMYNNQIKVDSKYGKDLYKVLQDVLSELQLNDFLAALEAADVENLTAEVAADVVAKYAVLTSEFQGKLTREQYTKLLKVATPFADEDDFAEFVANFKTTPVDREAIGGKVIWTEEGVQTAVDGLWEMISSKNQLGKVLGLLGIDLSNGIEPLLAGSLYTPETVAAIFDLYAMLSHDQTETGVGLVPTLGAAIEMILGTSVSNAFNDYDNRFAGAAEKFAAVTAPTSDEKAEGITKFDKYAAAAKTFTAEDLGLDGTQDAFVDALLAALRPVSAILSEELNSLLGLAGIKINLFDKVNADGTVAFGIYSQLIPLLETLGIEPPTPADFRDNYFTVKAEKDQNAAYDEILGTIVRPLLANVVNPILADPLNGLIEVLPRLAYVIDTDMINNLIGEILPGIGGPVADLAGSLDLSKEAIIAMIPKEVDLTDLIGMPLVLQIPEIDFTTLANCCTLEVRPSASNENANYILRVADVDSTFTEVFKLLYGILTNEQLLDTLQGALEDLLGADIDPDTGMTNAETLLSMYTKKKLTVARLRSWGEMGEVAAYRDFLETFGEAKGADLHPVDPPVDPENPDVKPPVNPDDKAPTVPNDGNKKPSIPNTGAMEAVGASFAYVMAASLIGFAVYMLLKKREIEE